MGVLIALVAGLTVWIVGWSLTASAHGGFDWFLPLLAFVLIALVARQLGPLIRRLRP